MIVNPSCVAMHALASATLRRAIERMGSTWWSGQEMMALRWFVVVVAYALPLKPQKALKSFDPFHPLPFSPMTGSTGIIVPGKPGLDAAKPTALIVRAVGV
jgi:hypothetical protein